MTAARLAAARVLVALERGRTTLAAEVERGRPDLPDGRDRALFLEIVTGVVRWRDELDACLAARSSRGVDSLSPEVRAVLRLGAYQLLHLDRIPAHAVVNESVEATRVLRQEGAAGFVNAVLRGLLRGKDVRAVLPARPADPDDTEAAIAYLATTLSHPRWLVERWLAREGFEAAERWCRFNNAAPEVTLRPLPGTTADELLEYMRHAGIEAEAGRFVRDAIRLPPGMAGQLTADLHRTLVIQDEASQLVAYAVGTQAGERVLDVCAAPGGKTLILCQHAGPQGLVVAGDHRPARIALLQSMLARAGATARVLGLDAAAPLPFGPVFDRVLLDAPCSGLGTIRRDPDLKWTRRPDDLSHLGSIQRQMIGHAAGVVRPGGTLIYATCSSEPEENEEVVESFLASAPDFHLAPLTFDSSMAAAAGLLDSRGVLRTKPCRDDLDAFFAAKLVRQQTA